MVGAQQGKAPPSLWATKFGRIQAVCCVSKMGWLTATGITQIIACCWEAVTVTEFCATIWNAEENYKGRIPFISRLMESSDYPTFLLTLPIEKFGSPGTTGSFCLSGASFLRTEMLYFPKCYSWKVVWLSPFRNWDSAAGQVMCRWR